MENRRIIRIRSSFSRFLKGTPSSRGAADDIIDTSLTRIWPKSIYYTIRGGRHDASYLGLSSIVSARLKDEFFYKPEALQIRRLIHRTRLPSTGIGSRIRLMSQ